MDVRIRLSWQAVPKGRLPNTASIAFSTDALHAGQDSYSPVSAYKVGGTYVAARSNEFGYANYELVTGQ